MKTFLFLFIIALAANTITAQQTYVPDDNFEQALIDLGLDFYPLNDSVPTKNIDTVSYLDVSEKFIFSLEGIEDFIELKTLLCNENSITFLNVSPCTKLEELDCSENDIIGLDISSCKSLRELKCNYNDIKILDVTKNRSLELLNCSNNLLTYLFVTQNKALTSLDLSRNDIKYLDVTYNAALIELACNWNSLSDLNVSMNTDLKLLDCNNNKISSLDLTQNLFLEELICYDNFIDSLDLSTNNKISTLLCNSNNITALDVSQMPNLKRLDCSFNYLTSLNIKNGNNYKVTGDFKYLFYLVNNPQLTCIQVDDSVFADTNSSWKKDPHAVYSEDCSLVSVEEEKYAGESITISPNPAEDYVEVKINDVILNEVKNPDFSVKIFDLLGAEILITSSHSRESGNLVVSNEIPNQVGNDNRRLRINISSLPKGVYFLKIGDVFKKFVKL